jgi:hypothetical protein
MNGAEPEASPGTAALKHRIFLFPAALVAAAVPFLVGITTWPEMIVPAYFLTRGGLFYKTIFFVYTPFVMSVLAATGALFGFSAALFRAVVSAAMAATASLIMLNAERRRGALLGAVVGVSLSILWLAYLEGIALWPDPLLAPVVLLASLLLERYERTGSEQALRAAGLVLGLGILIKQTSAWIALAALLWMALSRKRFRAIAALGLLTAAPYAAFAVLWGLVFRTTSHIYWTLVLPIFSSHGREIGTAPTLDDVHESVAPFLTLPGYFLLKIALRDRRRMPGFLMALGTCGMAYPRVGLLHLTAGAGLIALLGGRAVVSAMGFFRLWSRETLPIRRLAPAIAGLVLLVSAAGVAIGSGGSQLVDGRGHGAFYWDDKLTNDLLKRIRAHVPPGGRLFLYNVTRDTLYVRSGTLTPDGLYVNSGFWHHLERARLDERITAGLADFPGWILFRDVAPREKEAKATALYKFLTEQTVIQERVGNDMSWRLVKRFSEPRTPSALK